jgi:peptidoglycan/LPS O-acetylase OafA/YrhL
MNPEQFTLLIHPFFAVIFVFPLIGIVGNFAWQTRQRRLQIKPGDKRKISPVVGRDHLQMGKWLAGAVVAVTLLGLAHPITENILEKKLWQNNLFPLIFMVLMFFLTIASLVLLYRARPKLWRGIFATLTGMGIIILGCQEGIFRRTNEWYWSHYYYGIVAALLMIFSLGIVEEIYRDKSNVWRNIHIILNCFALFLFIGQGMTGLRDLFEIGLWTPPPGLMFPSVPMF